MDFCASVANEAAATNVITNLCAALSLCRLIKPHKSEHAVEELNCWKWLTYILFFWPLILSKNALQLW